MHSILKTKPLLYHTTREMVLDEVHWQSADLCPICQRHDALEDVALARGQNSASILSACYRCQLVFRRRRPSNSWTSAYYSREWDERGRATTSAGSQTVLPDSRVYDFCCEYVPTAASVLDIGAGLGKSASVFRARGYNITGIEASEHRARYVREVIGIPCEHTTLDRMRPSDRDFVYLSHVLEHIADPISAVNAASRSLKSDGLFYIAVPELWQEYPIQMLHFVPHVLFFTLEALTRLLSSAGFQVIKSAVDIEIRVLARKTEGSQTALPGSAEAVDTSNDFRARLANFFRTTTGGGRGNHALIWYRQPCARQNRLRDCYTTFAAPLALLRALRLGLALRERLPRRVWKYRLPGFAGCPKLWMVAAYSDGAGDLPLVFDWGSQRAPIWLK